MINLLKIIILFFMLFQSNIYSSEKDLMDLGKKFFNNGEYYDTITEMKRYQYLFPTGRYFPNSQLLMGRAYMKGNNYELATNALAECHNKYPSLPQGEKALFLVAYYRLLFGSPYYSLRTFQEYKFIYKKGNYIEDADMNICFAITLMNNLDLAKAEIKKYKSAYPNGKYLITADKLEQDIDEELIRPKKNVLLAGIGSAVLPGFGHFYSENYKLGILSLFSNAILIALICNAYNKGNMYQLVFFSIMELSFYQYSLFGGINSAYEYNNSAKFLKRMKLGLSHNF